MSEAHPHPYKAHAHEERTHAEHQHDRHEHFRELGRKRLVGVLALTFTFMLLEFLGGWIANSLALMADAGHMLSDVAALGLSIFALWFARRPATPAKTYGYLRIEILAALANGVTLVLIAIAILWQAYARFRVPQPVDGPLMLGVAAAGLIVNIVAAVLLHASSGHSLNIRAAYLHVLGDLLGSVGAIAAAVIILVSGWYPADPIMSCLVAVLILVGSWRLVRESVDVLLEAVPPGIDFDALRRAIAEIPGVEEVHDLHVWTLTSGYLAMSGHAIITDPGDHKRILQQVHSRMHEDFGINHVTMQVEHRTVYSLGMQAAQKGAATAPTPERAPSRERDARQADARRRS
jgi:cobalt-zinc-cadmium efflux system protein